MTERTSWEGRDYAAFVVVLVGAVVLIVLGQRCAMVPVCAWQCPAGFEAGYTGCACEPTP